MKSFCILFTYSLLILCGLVDWSCSYPAVGLEGALDGSMARDVKESGGGKTVFTDVNRGNKVYPSPRLDTSDKSVGPIGKTGGIPKDSRYFESLAGDDTRGSQFMGKVRTFFSSWPIKFWEKIKHWFAKLNFFKSKDEKVINPAQDAVVIRPEEGPVPNRSNFKGAQNDPTPSESSNGGSPPQPPNDSRGGSNVASHPVKPKNPNGPNNPNEMPQPAPSHKDKSNTNSQEAVRASSTAPRGPPRKAPVRGDPNTATENSNALTITKPILPSNSVDRNSQLIVAPSRDATPSHILTSNAIERHAQKPQTLDRYNQNPTALSVGHSEKPIFQSAQASYQVFPHGHDGSGTEVTSIKTQKVEVVRDPVTNRPGLRISAAISQSTVQGGPGHLQNLAALGGGPNMAIPTHAIDNQKHLLKGAGRTPLPWNGPSSTSNYLPSTNPSFGAGNKFVSTQKRPMEQNFQPNWGSNPNVPGSKQKAYLEEIEDNYPQEFQKTTVPTARTSKQNLDSSTASGPKKESSSRMFDPPPPIITDITDDPLQ
ncbi:uncharacterized protein MELLADRAFT_101573 [Melampsora larici-populina 98AG31]|uniref:Secreted protein n=1 Tax=Melampsora larici-populina (strain 98AG31 / pathotype 3-4-7) TaxID=747676 RepID=F4R6A3_MELLP|nr:uncharacterized protein MELLADRAFT_101573 [Melampsora larici-populina 98AG31]EGG12499.1 secreted protein [Melampsora larici-populina 98AG31]